jgi:hypothetical protein
MSMAAPSRTRLPVGRRFPEPVRFSTVLRELGRRDVGGTLSGSAPASEEKMLAGTDPESALDTRRLSEFSAEPENSHGAGNARRIQRRVKWVSNRRLTSG